MRSFQPVSAVSDRQRGLGAPAMRALGLAARDSLDLELVSRGGGGIHPGRGENPRACSRVLKGFLRVSYGVLMVLLFNVLGENPGSGRVLRFRDAKSVFWVKIDVLGENRCFGRKSVFWVRIQVLGVFCGFGIQKMCFG